MELSRRNLFQLGLIGGAGVAIAQAPKLIPGGRPAVDQLAALDLHRDLPEQWLPSVCAACATACPLWLRRVGDHVLGVRPGPGGACARAYTVPQELVHPDRVRTPLQLSAKRGSGTFQSLAVDAALDQVAGILREYGPKTAIVVPESAAVSVALLEALGHAIGAAHVLAAEWTPSQGPIDALGQATSWRHWRYDIAGANGLISFGWDWLQAHPNPTEAQKAFATLRERNAPMFFVGPRFNPTAARSNEWIACRPGFEPLVALAIAHLLLKEGRIKTPAGLESFAEAVAGLNLSQAERQSNVPLRRLREMAQVVAARQPFLCLCGRDRLPDQWAVVALNTLLGNVGRDPGGLVPAPRAGLRPAGATNTHPVVSPRDAMHAEDLPPLIGEGRDIDAIILVDVNPVFCSPAPGRWHEALRRAKHVVCVTSLMDETAALADVIIPLALPAERQDAYHDSASGQLISVPDDLARTSGVSLTDSSLEESQSDVRLKPDVRPLFDSAVQPPQGVLSAATLAFELARRLDVSADTFPWQTLSDAVRDWTVDQPKLAGVQIPATAADWTPPNFGESELHLLLETPVTLPRGQGGHLPQLLTTVAPHLREWWTTWVEVNPETARHLRLVDRDEVIVESKAGSIRARVKIFPGVPPDAVAMALGLGHRVGQFAQREGGNPAELIEWRQDETTRLPLWNLQKVSIRKA